MTDTNRTLRSRLPEGAVAWRDAAPWPGSPERDMGESTLGPEGTCKALSEHFAAMAHAHLEEYGVRLVGWSRHCDDCATATQPHAGEYLRGLIRDHLEPGIAAFTAAALLNGFDAERVVRAVENAQLMHELTWGWLPAGVDPEHIAPASEPIPADASAAQREAQ